ncbi:MAG TPA: ABC transporter permease [Bryobacteraceae bacterium]|nr:ABC transporter permease [Bryobacteraceae bacterium]
MGFDGLWQDLRHGLRIWRSRPSLYSIALIALALGIGANTTIFSVVESVLIKPLPYRDASRLVDLFETQTKTGVQRYFVSPSDFFDWKDRSRLLEAFAGYWRNEVNLTDAGAVGEYSPERLPCISMTPSLLGTLGIQPILGRGMTEQEGLVNGPDVALITSELWQRRYGSDAGIVGKTIGINGLATTVIGVLPSGIHFAGDTQVWNNGIRSYRHRPTPRYMDAIARLRPGVTLANAQSEMDAIARGIAAESPNTNADWGVGLRPLPDDLMGGSRPALLVLLGSVGILLLIACANVANLLLAHGSARQREVAVRAALGASAGRLARQFFTESLMLAMAGGCAGLFIAIAGVRSVGAFGPASIPRIHDVALSLPVLFFTLAISVVSGLLFGMAPMLRARHPELATALKETVRGGSGGARERLGRNILVVAQVTLAVVLVNGAGLLIKSFTRLVNVDPGFRTEQVLTANISLPVARYVKAADVANTFDRIRAMAEGLPGVKVAGETTSLPLAQDFDYRLPFRFLSLPAPRQPEDQSAWHRMVSAGFFAALRTPLIAGRDFSDHDGADSPAVVIINEALARQYWPRGNPIGQKIRAVSGGFGPLGRILLSDPEIVGLVKDMKYAGLGRSAEPAIYFPSRQAPFASMTLVVRTDASLSPESLIATLRRRLRDIDPDLPLSHIQTMSEQVSESVAQTRFQTMLLAVFSALALLLGSVGIYGVLSYAVVSRTREIGIRTALGGRPADILRLILGEGLSLVACGVALGIVLSLAAGRALESLLFQVKPADPSNLIVVCALLAGTGLLAGFAPARAASRIDPGVALRDS